MSWWAVGLAATVAQVILMTANVALETAYGHGFWSALVGFVAILVFPAVGLAILRRHPRHLVGLLFCISQLGWAMNNLSGTYARAQVLPFSSLAVWFYVWPGLLSSSVFIILLLVFPDGRFLSRRWRRLGQVVLVGTVIAAGAAAIAPGPVDSSIGIAADNPFGIGGPFGDVAVAISGAGFPLQVPLFVTGAVAMVRRYRNSGLVEREQLKWFASSVVLTAAMVVVALVLLSVYPDPAATPLWAQIAEQVTVFSVSLVPVAAGVAILRYRLYDIDVLIRRTLIYAALSAVLVGAYVAGVALFQALLAPFTAGSGVAVAVSTLGVVALFQPFRGRIQRTVDRRFYRSKYDAERTLDAFAARLRAQIDLGALEQELLAVVDETLQPTRASVWLRGR